MDDVNCHHCQNRLLILGVAAATSVCLHYATLLMSQDQQKAVWSSEETAAFIKYLYENRSQAGDGGNFKSATFTATSEVISPLLQYGPKKTGKMCRTKWTSVSDPQALPVLATDT
jgi:hypothetical protein